MALKLRYLDDTANDRRKRTFTRHEGLVTKQLAGIATIGSGNKGMKGDVWAGDPDAGQRLMVECKATERDSVVLKLAWLDKLAKEARESNREPVLAVRYRKDGDEHDWALVPATRWEELADVIAQPPDIIVPARQTTLSFRTFVAWGVGTEPAILYFKAAGSYTPKAWAVMPLDRLKDLYAFEAARRTAPPTNARG